MPSTGGGPLPGIGVHAAPDSLHGDGGDVLHINDRPWLDLAETVIEVHDPELLEDLVPQLFDALGRILLVGPQGEHGADGLFVTVTGDIVIRLAVGCLEVHAVHVDGQRQDMLRRMLQHPVDGAAGQVVTGRTGLGQELVQLAGENTAHLRADRHFFSRCQLFRGTSQAEHGRDAEFACQGKEAGPQQAVLGDDGSGPVHQRSPQVQVALHHKDAAVREIEHIGPRTGDDHRAAGTAAAGGDAAGQQGRRQAVVRAGLGLFLAFFRVRALMTMGRAMTTCVRPEGYAARPWTGGGRKGLPAPWPGRSHPQRPGRKRSCRPRHHALHRALTLPGRRPGNVHHVDGHQGIFHVLRQAAAKIDMDVAALQVDGIGRMRHAPEAALLHGKTGDADAGIGFHQTAGTPVDQGLGLLLAGQRRVQARQDVHVGGVQGYGGPPRPAVRDPYPACLPRHPCRATNVP